MTAEKALPIAADRSLVLAALLFALTLVAYAPSLGGEFIWDDDDYVTNNPNLRSLVGLREIWTTPKSSPQYYPLVFTSFWFEHQLWGLQPGGYHLVNVLLHATAALLLWRVLLRLDIPCAYLAAILFALHPVHVESVAWITERKNVLSAVFYFGAALVWLRHSVSGPEMASSSYFVVLLLFVLALLSKTVTCTLPAALLLMIWWKRGRITRWSLAAMIPMLVIGIWMALYTAQLEIEHVNARGREWEWPILDRLLIAGRVIWFYPTKLLLPVNLSFIYPRWPIDSTVAWQWAFPVAAAVVVVVLWLMRGRWGRGPLVAALLYIGTLVPALGFFNIYPMRYSYVADHFQYHASAALLVLIALGLVRLLRAAPQPAQIAVVAAPLLVLTMMRSSVYRDHETLWRDTLAKNPNSWMVHLNLAKVLAERGREDEARVHFERQAVLGKHLPETHWNLGISLARQGDLDGALRSYDRALGRNARFPQAYFARGNVYLQKGDLAQAAREFRRASDYKSGYAEAHFNLGLVLEQQNELHAAIGQYRRAIESRGTYAKAHNQLGQVLAKTGQYERALQHYEQAIAADPKLAEARVNRAALLAASGRMDEARAELSEAIRLDPALERHAPQILRTP